MFERSAERDGAEQHDPTRAATGVNDVVALGSMILSTSERTELVKRLPDQLLEAAPDSDVLLRGSLAEHRADFYSDIDLLWEVPDAHFAQILADLPAVLERVQPLASLRFDPDFQRSGKRRLAFARFANVPLFWRVDLDIFAASVGRDPDYDRNNAASCGSDWSLTESALMNAIAAVRAHLRGRDEEARGFLTRAETRVGVAPSPLELRHRIERLLAVVTDMEPPLEPFTAEIRVLVADAFQGLQPRACSEM